MTSADLILYEEMCSDDPRRVDAATRLLTHRVKTIAMRYVQHNSGNEVEAEDIVQETVLDVWRQMRSGAYQPQPETPLDAYLYRIVKNKWLKVLAKRQPGAPGILDESLPDEIPIEHYQTDLLQRAFGQLGAACQHILRLFYWEGFKMDEIAGQLDILVPAAKERKYRCMLRLAALLTKEQP